MMVFLEAMVVLLLLLWESPVESLGGREVQQLIPHWKPDWRR